MSVSSSYISGYVKVSDLKPWDGKIGDPYLDYPMPQNLWIDKGGNVYYYTNCNKPKLMTWCAASRLRGHLRHLRHVLGDGYYDQRRNV